MLASSSSNRSSNHKLVSSSNSYSSRHLSALPRHPLGVLLQVDRRRRRRSPRVGPLRGDHNPEQQPREQRNPGNPEQFPQRRPYSMHSHQIRSHNFGAAKHGRPR